jgi:glutathione transport system substrate-binding protein
MRENYWTRSVGRPFGRRRLLAGAAAGAGALALMAAGCGDDDNGGKPATAAASRSAGAPTTVPKTPTETPRVGGTWRVTGAPATGQTADPHFAVTAQGTKYYADPLLQMGNASRQISGSLIEKWEQPDQNTLIMHVRPGVKFFNKPPANGRAAEAKDVVYQIRSMTGSLYPDSKIPFPRKDLFTGAKDPVAVDPATVRMEFTSPRSDILYSLAEDRVGLVPEGLREFFGGSDSLSGLKVEHLVGTGPFIPDSVDTDGTATYKKNPDYWNKPYPYLDGLSFAPLKDISAWVTAMIAGQNDYVERVDPTLVDIAKKGLPDTQVAAHASNSFRRVSFNTRIKPYDDPRVRHAINLIFDKPAFSSVIFGKDYWRYPGPMPFLFPEALPQDQLAAMPGFRSPTPEDINNAKQLLSAAGVGNGFTTTISAAVDIQGTPAFKQVAEHLQAQAQKYLPGVTINIDGITYTQVLAKIAKPDGWEMATISAFPEISPVNNMSVFYFSKGGRNNSGLVNPKMDTLINNAFAEIDVNKRAQILRDAQMEAIDTQPDIWTHTGLNITIMRPEVRGLDLGGTFDADHTVRFAWLTKG